MKQLHDDIADKITDITQDYLVELFEVNVGDGSSWYLSNDTNEIGTAIVFNGISYQPYPIQADGFELTGQGTSPRPKLTISNLFGLVTMLVESYEGGLGATITRRQVYATHLDAVNFKAGNANANPNAQVVSYYQIEQYENLTAESATFVLCVPSETDQLVLPRRTVVTGVNGYPILDIS